MEQKELPVHHVLALNSCITSEVELAQVEQSKSEIGHHEGQTQKGVRSGTAFRDTVGGKDDTNFK